MSQHPSGVDPAAFPEPFASQYRSHLPHLPLKCLRHKTIEAYADCQQLDGVDNAVLAPGYWVAPAG